MGYTRLPNNNSELCNHNGLDLKSAAVKFICNRCEDLRFDEEKEKLERAEGKNLGKSTASNQIPYNMQMDIERLCLENAMKRFLNSGVAQDAFDVYFCYLEMFIGSYGNSRMMIEMLSEFETNGSSLLMKHRDHYSHSVYVFALGLAIYETNAKYREKYKNFYGFGAEEEQKAAHHFLQFWGLSSLFHDIGYPFELPFEQVESYFEVKGKKRKYNPFMAYIGMERFIAIEPEVQEALKELYGPKNTFTNTNELFAYDIAEKLGKTYRVTKDGINVILTTKPTSPDIFGYFMDHAYFSASVLFQELCNTDKKANKNGMSKARIDALTAIILHNSLYKFSIAFYKEKVNNPFEMELHPLAYMLMICDELQCWDRTSYGRNSRTELHPMNCEFVFGDNTICARYIYDEAEKDKIDRYEMLYEAWDKVDKKSKPALKAYASMVHENDFLNDIKRIVNTADLGLNVEVGLAKAQHGSKKVFLSESNFIHLYNFAVALNGRYSHQGNEYEPDVVAVTEEEFDGLSLEYKLSNIGQAKAFAGYLDKINCFYTDRAVDFEIVTEFTGEDMQIIGPLEHGRWVREHKEMGWQFGDTYQSKAEREQKRIHKCMMDEELTQENILKHYLSLPEDEQDKDFLPMNSMLKLLKQYEGVRIYRL